MKVYLSVILMLCAECYSNLAKNGGRFDLSRCFPKNCKDGEIYLVPFYCKWFFTEEEMLKDCKPETPPTPYPPTTSSTITTPVSSTSVTPDPSSSSVSPDPSSSSVSPDPTMSSVSPDPSMSSVSPDPTMSSVSPDPTMSSVSPDPTMSSVSPDPSSPSTSQILKLSGKGSQKDYVTPLTKESKPVNKVFIKNKEYATYKELGNRPWQRIGTKGFTKVQGPRNVPTYQNA